VVVSKKKERNNMRFTRQR
jgi:hypothetical protein